MVILESDCPVAMATAEGDRAGGFFLSPRKMSDSQSWSESFLTHHSLYVSSGVAVRRALMHHTPTRSPPGAAGRR